MKIRDIMRRDPIVLQVSDPLHLARSTMAWMEVRHLPVLHEGRLVGVLGERDLLAYGAGNRDEDWLNAPVERAMRAEPKTASPDDSVTEAAGRMAMSKVGCLPVTELGRLVGIITSTDVLNAQVFQALQSAPRSTLLVKDVMTPDVISIHPDDRVLDAVARMQQHRVRHLVVKDGSDKLVGMLSDRDIRRAIGNPIEALEPGTTRVRVASMRVRDVMSHPVLSATPQQAVTEMARFFVRHSIGAVPVLDEQGGTVGVLSYVDVLRGLAS
jgi:CBS domain-containing protein